MRLLVSGMHCPSCEMLIGEVLEDEGVKNVTITLDKEKQLGTIALETTKSFNEIKRIIEGEGNYTVRLG